MTEGWLVRLHDPVFTAFGEHVTKADQSPEQQEARNGPQVASGPQVTGGQPVIGGQNAARS